MSRAVGVEGDPLVSTARMRVACCAISCAGVLLGWQPRGAALDPSVHPSLYGHDAWTTDQGLPQNNVAGIARTADGYLWIGTHEGLARFDGLRFTRLGKADSSALQNAVLSRMLADDHGNLWIGTWGRGLLRFANGKLTSITEREGLPQRSVSWLSRGRKGRIWVVTQNGVAIIQGGRILRADLPAKEIRRTLEDSRGNLWIGTRRGLRVKWKGKWRTVQKRHGLVDDRVDSIFEDEDRVVWVGTKKGGLHRFAGGKLIETLRLPGTQSGIQVIRQDRHGNLWLGTWGSGLFRYSNGRFARFAPEEGLVGARVLYLLEDPEGSLWIGTVGGLNRLRDQNIHTYAKRHGLPNDYVWAAAEDRQGRIWLGTEKGLHRLALSGGPRKTLGKTDGLLHERIFSLLAGRQGKLWIGTFAGLNVLADGRLRRFDDKRLTKNPIRTMHQGSRGDLWLGTEGGGLIRFNGERVVRVYKKKDGLLSNRIYALLEDGNGGLWIGSVQGGLNHLSRDGVKRFGRREGFTASNVMAFHLDAKGVLWIATYGSGLFRFAKGRFTRYTVSMGMSDDRQAQVFEQGGWLWITGMRGIFRVAKAQLEAIARGERKRITSQHFGRQDGMLSPECNGGGVRANDGRLWLPTARGVSVFHPNRWKTNQIPPPTAIEQVLVNGKAADPTARGDFPAGSSKFEFRSVGLSFLVPKRVRYRYKLEGFDKRFVDSGARRIAYYTNLSPGRYRFVVQAANNDGVWNVKGASFAFVLRPFFYQTGWFYGLCGVLLVALGFGGHRLRIRRLKARQRMLEQQVAERTQQLAEANEKLWAEMELAKQIQLAILPPGIELPDLDTFGMMVPAEEVGGDYFDVQIGGDGRVWFMIGDVSGHGVTSGLVMMMAQTAVATALQGSPGLQPDELIGTINEPIRDNVRRLKESKFLTLTALAYEGEGRFAHAGLHQDLLVWRAEEKRVAALETTGAWVAMMSDLQEVLEVQHFSLGMDDVLVLYTDGVTEAAAPDGGELYGIERLTGQVGTLAARGLRAEEIAKGLVADVFRYAPQNDDDVSVFVIRRRKRSADVVTL